MNESYNNNIVLFWRYAIYMIPDCYNDMCNGFCPYASSNQDMYNTNISAFISQAKMRTATMEEINDEQYEPDDERYKDEKIIEQKSEKILMEIEKNNPMLLAKLTSSGIPYYAARKIAARIVYLTLLYRNDE